MHAGTLVLLPGPLDPQAWWAETGSDLVRAGHSVVAPELSVRTAPFAISWIAFATRTGLAGTGPVSWWARLAEQRGWIVAASDHPLDAALPDVLRRLPG